MRVGGRRKGTKNKLTVLREVDHHILVAEAAAAGETPLEYMLRVMRTSDDYRRCDAMAAAAAPYLHPKLATVEHKGDKDNPISYHIVSGVPRGDDMALADERPLETGYARQH